MSLWESYTVIPGFFNIVHTKNRGVVFGMFNGRRRSLRTLLLVGTLTVLLFVATVLFRPGKGGFQEPSHRLALSLVLGGALGNLWTASSAEW